MPFDVVAPFAIDGNKTIPSSHSASMPPPEESNVNIEDSATNMLDDSSNADCVGKDIINDLIRKTEDLENASVDLPNTQEFQTRWDRLMYSSPHASND